MERKKHSVLVTGLCINNGCFGGIVNFNKLLLKYISKERFDVNYFSLGESPAWYNGEKKVSKRTYHFKLFLKLFQFVYVCFSKNIDVVIVNSNLSFTSLLRDGFFAILSRLVGVKTIFVFHGWQDDVFDRIQKSSFYSKVFKWFLTKQSVIAASSTNHIEKIHDLSGFDKKHTFTFSTMVESKIYEPSKDLIKDIDVLFAANPLSKFKGINELLIALSYLRNSYSNLNIVIIGGGPDLEKYKIKAKQLNIEDIVSFQGFVTNANKIELFQRSKIFILPSYTEGFPNVVLEAMAAKSALIVTPVGGLKEAITDKVNGLVIKSMPPDPNEISNHIDSLLKNNNNLVNKIINNNIEEVRNKYEVKIVASLFESKIQSCVSESNNEHKVL